MAKITTPINNTGTTGFSENGSGAAFGNPTLTRQGQATGATQVEYQAKTPPKAPAAPVAGKNNIFTGLCDALNQHQQDLVKAGKRQYADIYEIKFAPPALAAYQVKKPGKGTDITVTAQQTPNSAAKLNPARNKVATDTQTWQVQAGTQIVQVIDQIMRNSTYITDQQLWQYDPVPDPKTGIQQLRKNPKAGTGVTAWYKISVQATQLKFDNVINDDAYRITFIINTYALADLHSEYFSPIPYSGVHKSYNYWFTGQNTQILNFEQKIDNMYRLAITGIGNTTPQTTTASTRNSYLNEYYQYRKTYMATSSDRAIGAKGYTNEPGDNAASFLYDLASMALAKLEIVGDPAWMQQGEVSTKFNWKNFNFNPFNADGGINYDSRQILFDISFNQPTDYDFNTGIMDVNSNNTPANGPLGNLPQQNYTYVAHRCRSVFSKGSFKQQLEGHLKFDVNKTPKASSVARKTGSNVATGSRGLGIKQSALNTGWDDSSNGITGIKESAMGTGWDDNTSGELGIKDTAQNTGWNDSTAGRAPPTPQPALPPKPPTSSGPLLDLTPTTSFGGVNLTTTPTLNPNATGQTLVPQPTSPQKMNREF